MQTKRRACPKTYYALTALVSLLSFTGTALYAEQPPPPCHPNPLAAQDRLTVANRGDVVHLPQPLKDRLIRLADRPHSQLPTQAYAEADKQSQLFQYYLLDTSGFEPNVFTARFPGINDTVQRQMLALYPSHFHT